MERIETIGPDIYATVQYRLGNGRVVRLDRMMVEEYGIEAVLKACGYGDQIPTGRLPVYQGDRKVGTLPAAFDPASARSRSFLTDIRPGDFVRDGQRWVANRMLGPGDFDNVPGFERG